MSTFTTRAAMPRRTFLRGVGATLALPLLDAMIPALAAPANAAAPVRRLAYLFMPMGADMPRWTPPGSGKLDELSFILSSLEPVKEHVSVLTNLEVKNAYPGTHATSNAAFGPRPRPLAAVHTSVRPGASTPVG